MPIGRSVEAAAAAVEAAHQRASDAHKRVSKDSFEQDDDDDDNDDAEAQATRPSIARSTSLNLAGACR